MGLRAKFALKIDIVATESSDLGNRSYAFNEVRGTTFTDGTGANKADVAFEDQRSLADGLDETLDLHDGSLLDVLKNALTMDILRAMYIKNRSTSASLLIGGAVANAMGLFSDSSDAFVLKPGGEKFVTAPDANGVDLTTDAHLKLAHNGDGTDALVYDIILVGED